MDTNETASAELRLGAKRVEARAIERQEGVGSSVVQKGGSANGACSILTPPQEVRHERVLEE
jgi:hypothetical protein